MNINKKVLEYSNKMNSEILSISPSRNYIICKSNNTDLFFIAFYTKEEEIN